MFQEAAKLGCGVRDVRRLLQLLLADPLPGQEREGWKAPSLGIRDMPTDEELENVLIRIMNDAFNRSIGALERSGALDTRKMRSPSWTHGYKSYDLVTEQMTYTAKVAVPGIKQLFEGSDPATQS
jgi:hypothetical protein